MKRSFLLIVSITLLLSGCSSSRPTPLSEEKKDALINELIARNDFIGIFEHREELVEVTKGRTRQLDKPVKKFILDCCSDKASAIKLLEENGFKVNKAEGWFTKGYTEVFHGMRLSQTINFVLATQYHVTVYLIDGKVKKVTSAYFTDLKNAGRKPIKSRCDTFSPGAYILQDKHRHPGQQGACQSTYSH